MQGEDPPFNKHKTNNCCSVAGPLLVASVPREPRHHDVPCRLPHARRTYRHGCLCGERGGRDQRWGFAGTAVSWTINGKVCCSMIDSLFFHDGYQILTQQGRSSIAEQWNCCWRWLYVYKSSGWAAVSYTLKPRTYRSSKSYRCPHYFESSPEVVHMCDTTCNRDSELALQLSGGRMIGDAPCTPWVTPQWSPGRLHAALDCALMMMDIISRVSNRTTCWKSSRNS